LGQIVPDGKEKVKIVPIYPADLPGAAKPIYNKP
jgi:hypothetical protein